MSVLPIEPPLAALTAWATRSRTSWSACPVASDRGDRGDSFLTFTQTFRRDTIHVRDFATGSMLEAGRKSSGPCPAKTSVLKEHPRRFLVLVGRNAQAKRTCCERSTGGPVRDRRALPCRAPLLAMGTRDAAHVLLKMDR